MRLRAPLLTAALACLLALSGCGDQPSGDAATSGGSTGNDSAAVATPVGPDTTIPDDFPLSAGMGGPEDTIPTTRTGTGLRDLELCGTSPLRGLGERDRMVADNSGGEALSTRELVLLGSPERAAEVARSLSDLASGCSTPTTKGKWETLTEVRGSSFGPSPSAVLVQTFRVDGEPAPGAIVIQVVPAGAALLVTQVYGEWEDLDAGLADVAGTLDETVSALEAFADGQDPTQEPTEEPTSGSGAVTEIPADFPLGVGLPQDDGETKVYGPAPDADGMGEVEMCGRVVWPHPRESVVGETGRLVAGASGPEWSDARELIVHTDADAALEAMEAVREASEECRSAGTQVWTVLDHETGYDTVTMGLTYSDGLGSSVFQVTRVGSARLMVSTYGEGSLASLDAQADGVTETTTDIVSAMCVFTKTGC